VNGGAPRLSRTLRDYTTVVMIRILTGDAREVLATMLSESVHCVVTSPPYYGLRDYGTAQWADADAECDHRKSELRRGVNLAQSTASTRGGAKKIAEAGWIPYGQVCARCGATRIDSQLGLESTPAEYITNMVGVFREVRRVLRKDGTCWVNIGDSYASGTSARRTEGTGDVGRWHSDVGGYDARVATPPGLKTKDLIGIPWLLAFALRDDGWYLRADIIWSKPNPMPESVTDRPTKAHEYVFLLTKSARYFYDADAIREAGAEEAGRVITGLGTTKDFDPERQRTLLRGERVLSGFRNKRSVWEIATEPFPGSHFAVFPTALVEPCIKAGTSEKGCCPECGAPWVRVTQIEGQLPGRERNRGGRIDGYTLAPQWDNGQNPTTRTTVGWRPSCAHADLTPVPCTVLDPFMGAGTTLMVADRLQRDGIGIELSPEYAEMARKRLTGDAPLFVDIA
jgi:DNA modification methylase